jgi:hypothetical protein
MATGDEAETLYYRDFFLYMYHSFKNWTDSPIEPKKTGTSSLAGLLGAQDRTRHRTAVRPLVFALNRLSGPTGLISKVLEK